jgi:hypothetical protein
MIPAERLLAEVLQLVAEMPDDPRLAEAAGCIFRAADLIGDYVRDPDRHRSRAADTMPSGPPSFPPPSFRDPLETMPEGAE